MPVGGFSLVANIFFGHYWLKEPLTRYDIIGTVLIILGVIVTCVSGSRESPSYTLSQLLELYARWDMFLYAILLTVFLLAT
jgi:drug/metabolite transporter (DMT)-like permease